MSNGIPIPDFLGDPEDEILLPLTKYLRSFKDVEDVRVKIDDDFRIKQFLEEKANYFYVANEH